MITKQCIKTCTINTPASSKQIYTGKLRPCINHPQKLNIYTLMYTHVHSCIQHTLIYTNVHSCVHPCTLMQIQANLIMYIHVFTTPYYMYTMYTSVHHHNLGTLVINQATIAIPSYYYIPPYLMIQ